MTHTSFRLSSPLFACAIGIVSTIAMANVQQNAQERDERALELLRNASNQLLDVDSATARIRARLELQGPNIEQHIDTNYTFAYENKSSFALRLREPGSIGRSFISDGDTLTTHVPAFDVYAEEDAPDSLREFLRKSAEEEHDEIGGHPLVLLGAITEAALNADNNNDANDNDNNNNDNAQAVRITRALDAGDDEVGNTQTRRLEITLVSNIPEQTAERMEAMLGEDLETREIEADLVVWIEEGNPTTFRRIRVEDVRFLDENIQSMREEFTRYSAQRLRVDFRDWQINEEVTAEHFEFQPPQTARKVETIDEKALLTVIFPRR